MTATGREKYAQRILTELEANRGSIVSRQQLLAAMYRNRTAPLGATECLRVQITKLRRSLPAPWRIVSVRGVGYRLTDKPPAYLSPI
jgi:DNA-binding response OmpR family regulator